MSDVRVRIAPSPTGYLHVGTARTALFNYLFAKRHGGKFILRIEDTDAERSSEAYTKNIFDSLHALNISWDEGPDVGGPYAPYRQTERMSLYKEWIQKLLDSGKAYHCYCTEDELAQERAKAQESKENYRYSGRCRNPQTREELSKDPSRKPVVRFEVPAGRGEIVVKDHVRGDVTFDSGLMGDYVIEKSDGMPTYTLANVVDDSLMKITHILRGEDLLSNTPNQILLYEAFGQKVPEFAHLSLILAPDRTKLSKRHGATAVSDFMAKGYIPEAVCNFLTLLGWSPPDGEEIATLAHYATQFSLDRISNSAAVFDRDKLDAVNARYLHTMEPTKLLKLARPFLTDFDLNQYPQDKLLLMMEAVRERLTLLSEFPDAVNYFFGQKVPLDAQFVGEVLTGEEPAQVLRAFKAFLVAADFSSPEAIAPALKEFTSGQQPIKTKTVMWSLRGAVTGRTHGADLSQVLYILGKETVLSRVETALSLTTGSPA